LFQIACAFRLRLSLVLTPFTCFEVYTFFVEVGREGYESFQLVQNADLSRCLEHETQGRHCAADCLWRCEGSLGRSRQVHRLGFEYCQPCAWWQSSQGSWVCGGSPPWHRQRPGQFQGHGPRQRQGDEAACSPEAPCREQHLSLQTAMSTASNNGFVSTIAGMVFESRMSSKGVCCLINSTEFHQMFCFELTVSTRTLISYILLSI